MSGLSRRRLRDTAPAVGGAACLVLGLATLVAGPGDRRLSGVFVLLFGLALILVPLAGRLRDPAGAGPRLDRVDGEGMLVPAVVVDGQRRKLRVMQVMIGLMAILGLLLALAPESLSDTQAEAGERRFAGILCAAAFGGGLAISLLGARGRFVLALIPDGLRWEAGAAPAFVAWDDILAVELIAIHGAPFLGLELAGDDALRTSRTQRGLARAGSALVGADVSVPLGVFPVDHDRLMDAIGAYADRPELRREIGIERGLVRVAGGGDVMPPASSVSPRIA
jgi:hypothetical protein